MKRNKIITICILGLLLLSSCENATTEKIYIIDAKIERVRSMVDRYVELQYPSGAPSLSWAYNSKNELTEYSDYIYDDTSGLNTSIKSYSSESANKESLLGEYVFTYDEFNNILKCVLFDSSKKIIMEYSATYNSKGRYLTYVSKDSDGDVLESRVSTYDQTGENYLTETYYVDEARTIKLEEYVSEYDPLNPAKYIREKRYINVLGGEVLANTDQVSDYKGFESLIEYEFSWLEKNKDFHYLQESFNESGDPLDIIEYRFTPQGKRFSRSYYSHGKTQSYWTYSYSQDNSYVTELSYYDGKDKLTNLTTQRRYVNESGSDMYEKINYTYGYIEKERNLNGSVVSPDSRKLRFPDKNHRSN
jgi:hypothetical protein